MHRSSASASAHSSCASGCHVPSAEASEPPDALRMGWKDAARTKENRLATVRAELKQLALAREEQMAAAR